MGFCLWEWHGKYEKWSYQSRSGWWDKTCIWSVWKWIFCCCCYFEGWSFCLLLSAVFCTGTSISPELGNLTVAFSFLVFLLLFKNLSSIIQASSCVIPFPCNSFVITCLQLNLYKSKTAGVFSCHPGSGEAWILWLPFRADWDCVGKLWVMLPVLSNSCIVQEWWQRNNFVFCGCVFCLFVKPLDTGKYLQ